jgi:DNA-binding response OmpR family regulator
MAERPTPLIAVLNSSNDVVGMLRLVLEEEGFKTVTAHVPEVKQGQEDLLAFFARHNPRVVIYDVSLPYAENWTFLRLVLDTAAAKGRHFVVTTPNKTALEEAVGDTGTIELIGKPYDLEQILAAVRSRLKRRRRTRRDS